MYASKPLDDELSLTDPLPSTGERDGLDIDLEQQRDAPIEQYISRDRTIEDCKANWTCITTRRCLGCCFSCEADVQHRCFACLASCIQGIVGFGHVSRNKEKFNRARERKLVSAPTPAPGFDKATNVRWFDVDIPYKTGEPPAEGPMAMPCRIFEPKGFDGPSPLPIVLYFHGGGFVISSPRSRAYATMLTTIASLGAYVVAPEYRKAPENKFPGAVYDCFDTMAWLASEESEKVLAAGRADRKRIITWGDSCGGNLSLVIAYLVANNLDAKLDTAASETKEKLKLAHAVASYPWIPLEYPTKSCVTQYNRFFLSLDDLIWYYNSYVPPEERKSALRDVRLNPMYGNLANFPPTTIFTAEFDPLKDEGRIFAAKLQAAGVQVELVHEPKAYHGQQNYDLLKATQKLRKQYCQTIFKNIVQSGSNDDELLEKTHGDTTSNKTETNQPAQQQMTAI